jgi:hypothetical protein
MLSNDILKMYKRAKKRPETWRQSVNIGWLEDFIADKKQGWTYALELLAIYYDSWGTVYEIKHKNINGSKIFVKCI